MCVFVSLTQAVANYCNCPIEFWVSLFEEGVQPIDLCRHCVHDGLAVGGAVIEKQVEQSVIGEMSQPANTGKGDPLNVPGRQWRWEGKKRSLSALKMQVL